jgi:hypothetical protein
MAKVTDYKEWLSGVDLDGHQKVYDLYRSVGNFEGAGIFHTAKEVTNDGYQYLVQAQGTADSLFLESDQAKFEFLEYLAKNYTDEQEGDVQKWYKLKTELGQID